MDEQMQQAQQLAAQGMAALGKANGPAAAQAFEAAIKLGWPGADIWVTLSHARLLQQDKQGRLTALDQALILDPQNLRARFYYAEALIDQGDHVKAEGIFRTAISDTEGQSLNAEVQTLRNRAQVYLNSVKTEEALDTAFADLNIGQTEGDAEFQQSLDILTGIKRPYYPQPSKYLYPGLPTRQFYPRAQFDWVPALEAQTDTIRDELLTLLQTQSRKFQPYVEGSGREGDNLLQGGMTNNPDWSAFYLIKQGQRQEANIAACPRTMAAIDAITDACPAPAPSVLFSLLKPGAKIPPHHGMLNTRLICHLPLIIPDDCGFRVGNDTREWQPGEMFLFDDTIEHEAWNDSGQARYILIFELWRSELEQRQRDLVTRLFNLQKTGV